jgi:hypothetical protein
MRKLLKKFRNTVAGIAIGLSGAAGAAPMPSVSIPFNVDTTIDLSEAQAALQNTLNSTRQDSRCGSNYKVWDARVIPNGRSIKVDFNARFFENKCVIVTVPEWHGLFHMEMHDKVVGETILFSQAGHIAVDVWPVIENGAVTVDANVVTADMNGLLGRLKLNGQVKAFLTGKIRDALQSKLTSTLTAGSQEGWAAVLRGVVR